jgi:hypothetical protein
MKLPREFYTRANVLTVDSRRPRAEAFAVAGGKFVAVDFHFETLAEITAGLLAEDGQDHVLAFQAGVAVLEGDEDFAQRSGHTQTRRHVVFAVQELKVRERG